jgi:hypothetical protein
VKLLNAIWAIDREGPMPAHGQHKCNAQEKASNKCNEKNNSKCHKLIIFVKASILAKKLTSVAIVVLKGRRLKNTNSVHIY